MSMQRLVLATALVAMAGATTVSAQLGARPLGRCFIGVFQLYDKKRYLP